MARFEVFIPAATPDDMNMTLRVTADTWMAALKVGLKKIGETGVPQNVLCDVQDDESIHVTDPRNNRVFRIAQIPEVSNPGVGVVLPSPNWMAAPTDPAPQSDDALRAAAKFAIEKTAQEKAALERAAVERAAAIRAAEEKAAADRYAAEKALAEKIAAEASAKQRALAEKAAVEKAAAQKTAEGVRAQEKAAAASRAGTPKQITSGGVAKAQAEKAAAEIAKAAAGVALAEKAAAQKTAAEKAAADRAASLRVAAERAALESQAAERSAREKLAAELAAAEKAARETALAEQATAQKKSADKAVTAALHAPIPVKIVEVDNQKSPPPKTIGRLGQSSSPGEGARVEEVLSELFERTPEMFTKTGSDALYFMLDLAMEKVPCESGTFYVADLNRRDLIFAAVRGPKAQELLDLKLRIPMGKGFVGFCAQEGVAVAISDAQRDKRFYKEISQRLGYDTTSMITTPVIHENRTLGAIQLINRSGSSSFSPSELSILHYLAHQAALFLEAEGAKDQAV